SESRGFADLASYLAFRLPIEPPVAALQRLGIWIGEQVFGALRPALRSHGRAPAQPVQVVVPAHAEVLLSRPFEIACFADRIPFDAAGLRLIYQTDSAPGSQKQAGDTLRVLAAFSLPVRTDPLNLRRERYNLQRYVRNLNLTQNVAVDLRVLQYGATRD